MRRRINDNIVVLQRVKKKAEPLYNGYAIFLFQGVWGEKYLGKRIFWNKEKLPWNSLPD